MRSNDALLHALADGLEVEAGAETRAKPSSLQKFLEQEIVTESGPWTPEGHEPFLAPIALIDRVIRQRETDTEISILAAEQTGKTVGIAAGPAFHLVGDYGRDVIYFLPTDKFAHRFGRTRVKKLVSGSKYLREQLRDSEAVNQATLKEINGHFLYILGLESILNAISIPADVIISDEVDMLSEENREWADGRVAHSDLRLRINVSAGYTPGAGIDLLFQAGTQHKLYFDCLNTRRCGRKKINLEETFPACMAEVSGKWERVCPDCGKALDLKRGRWIASQPEKAKEKRYSFRISSLAVAARAGDHIMRRWEKAQKRKSAMAKFRCAELAIPDGGAMQPITDAELLKMRQRGADAKHQLRIARGERPRYAGVDSGDVCHLWVYERNERGNPVLLWAEIIDADVAAETIDKRIEQLGIVSLVWDKKPLTTVARKAAYTRPRIVALQDFQENSTLVVVDEEHQKKTYRCVKVDRNESLDELTSELTDDVRGLVLPDESRATKRDAEVLAEVAKHLKNGRKERVVTGTGVTKDKYVRNVANHFLMAANSARLAELIAAPFVRFEIALVDEDPTPWGSGRSAWGAVRG